MEGVTILNQISGWNLMDYLLVGIFILVFLVGVIMIKSGALAEDKPSIFLGIFTSFVGGFLFTALLCSNPNLYNRYEVTVSDDVSLNEFLERYDIVSVRGDIYTVKEKEIKHNGE